MHSAQREAKKEEATQRRLLRRQREQGDISSPVRSIRKGKEVRSESLRARVVMLEEEEGHGGPSDVSYLYFKRRDDTS
jgi:hypothetical protein